MLRAGFSTLSHTLTERATIGIVYGYGTDDISLNVIKIVQPGRTKSYCLYRVVAEVKRNCSQYWVPDKRSAQRMGAGTTLKIN